MIGLLNIRKSVGKSPQELLTTFKQLREKNLEKLKAADLSTGDLNKEGNHPALGLVTLAQLLATWTAHDLNHLAQISRVMVRQYSEEVGPWRTYMRILQA